MDTFTLKRTGLPELSFTGRLRVRDEGLDTDGSTMGRVHNVAVYEADDGELIVAIQFQSPFESEVSDSIVESVHSVEEADAVLSLYEPAERVDPLLFDQNESHRKQVVAALTTRFDRQVMGVLSKLATVEYA